MVLNLKITKKSWRGLNLFLVLSLFQVFSACPVYAELIDGDLAEEQAAEKEELHKMRNEMKDINSEIDDAMKKLGDVTRKASQGEMNCREFHLLVKEKEIEVSSGKTAHALTYNERVQGPLIRVMQGEPVRVILHNQSKSPTSLYFHGLKLPHSVSGLPRKDQGIVMPGAAFAYQFVPERVGTFWYYPQIIHSKQKEAGLYGMLVVDPKMAPSRLPNKDIALVFSQVLAKKAATQNSASSTSSPSTTVNTYLVNGKSAPDIPAIDLRKGELVRLRFLNAGKEAVPVHLSGHILEIVSTNGSDPLEPHVFRDSIVLQPGDRIDANFVADNPGVWSLGSLLSSQTKGEGLGPAGYAMVVRYSEHTK